VYSGVQYIVCCVVFFVFLSSSVRQMLSVSLVIFVGYIVDHYCLRFGRGMISFDFDHSCSRFDRSEVGLFRWLHCSPLLFDGCFHC